MLGITASDLAEQRLDFGIGVKAAGLLLENVICAHTASGEIPHALLILGAIGVGVKVARTVVALLLQQFDQEKHTLDILAAETQVLVEARPLLIVQIDMEEFSSLQGL